MVSRVYCEDARSGVRRREVGVPETSVETGVIGLRGYRVRYLKVASHLLFFLRVNVGLREPVASMERREIRYRGEGRVWVAAGPEASD